MKNLKAIGASKGIAVAKVYKLVEFEIKTSTDKISDVNLELTKFESAFEKTILDLENLKLRASEKLGEEVAAVFEAHLLMLQDPEMTNQIKQMIQEGNSSDYATEQVSNTFITMFESMVDNEYMQERAADIKDVRRRLIANIQGFELPDLAAINKEVIIFSEDLTPSETSQLDKKYVKGFVTEMGGRTSHSAIMARSLEIPAVTGLTGVLSEVEHGQQVAINGQTGEVIINPSSEIVEEFNQIAAAIAAEKEELLMLKDSKTVTNDGHQVELVANIGTPSDLVGVNANGAEGVGLYRTEFLYMDAKDFPTEEEQFEAYKKVLEDQNPKPVVIRTLDIGGDKELSYLKLPTEMNPFLGYRAIRMCLDRTDLFRTQIRALLRASAYGNLKFMFPMVSNLVEFRQAKQLVEEEKAKLITEGYKVSDSYELGIMIEIPAAAVIADLFAKEVDFMSIGTNDLIQYTMAADRMNEKVSYLYQPYNPAILRLVKNVIDAANKEGKWAGMCGEMAGEENALPILLGLGLHEFSMSATSILPARKIISGLSYVEMQQLAEEALNQPTQEDVLNLIKQKLNK
jgi:phosphotransferase system enzyme I (PtsI)